MSRDGIRSVASLVAGTALLLLGAVVPAHFRAVNESVLRAAGQGTGTVLDVAGRMLEEKRHGAARLLLEAGRTQDPARVESAGELLRVEALGRGWSMRWGGPADWLEGRLQRTRGRLRFIPGSCGLMFVKVWRGRWRAARILR
jgi:hypothetical protein